MPDIEEGLRRGLTKMLPEGKLPRSVCLWGADLKAINCREHASLLRDLRWTVGELIEWAILFLLPRL